MASPSRHYPSPQECEYRNPVTAAYGVRAPSSSQRTSSRSLPHRELLPSPRAGLLCGCAPRPARRLGETGRTGATPNIQRSSRREPIRALSRSSSSGGATKSAHYSCNAMRRMRNAVETRRESNRTDTINAVVPSGHWLLNQSILKKAASDESTLFLGRSRGGSCRIGPLKPRQRADALKRASFLEMLT